MRYLLSFVKEVAGKDCFALPALYDITGSARLKQPG